MFKCPCNPAADCVDVKIFTLAESPTNTLFLAPKLQPFSEKKSAFFPPAASCATKARGGPPRRPLFVWTPAPSYARAKGPARGPGGAGPPLWASLKDGNFDTRGSGRALILSFGLEDLRDGRYGGT